MKYLQNLVWDYRYSSPMVKEFVKIKLRRQPIETDWCNICYGEGFICFAHGPDDIDKDICDNCDNYDVRSAIKLAESIQIFFKYLELKIKKGGKANVSTNKS
mgnify:FL=1|jgi:hypothetical protein|tara:strand:- start:326 stop:631 length:306 start_codon:yes stop_codon:yes gene_type:complete